MSEREAFERRLEAAVREYVEAAPTDVDAARLTRSLAANVPRVRRLVPLPVWRLPSPGFAGALVALALLAVLSMGLVASGALRNVHLLPVAPTPGPALETPPAVIASPVPSAPAPSASASPSTSAAPTPSAAAATPASASAGPYAGSLAWTGFARLPRLHAGQALTDPIMGDITAGGPGFVAVGSDWVDPEGAVAVAWTSADGLSWQEHEIGVPGPTSALSTPALSSVAAGASDLVAVGRVGIWRSADGIAWEQARAPYELDGTPLYVAAGPGGFVAVGRGLGDPCQGRAWTSADGKTWQARTLPNPAGLCPTALAAGPSGYLAVGHDPVSGHTAMMRSADGASWEMVQDQAAFAGDGYPEGATWTASGWTAFGSFLPIGSSDRGVQVWQSSEGMRWQRTGFQRPAGAFSCDPGSTHMLDAAAFGPGYVAVGTCTANPEQVGLAWASTDGASWETVIGRVRPMTAVAANGQRLVAVGSDWPDHEPIVASAELAP